tara:strand:- start:1197 stop:1334 length:138 start_codon:yes stop_codon:yes gene_type:complete
MIDKDIALGSNLQALVMTIENLREWYSDEEIRRAVELILKGDTDG